MDEISQKTADYPRFADGRIDYSKERICFVLNCVVVCGDEVLLTRRSQGVLAYPGTLNGVSGFIDRTDISVEEQARIELEEELCAPLDQIERMVVDKPFTQEAKEINREWHVYAVLVEFKQKFSPKINWENKEVGWHSINDARHLKLMPGFGETLDRALALR
jgi:hypothetical protein